MQKIHIVPHTHWDREWYKPFQYFRVKLIFVIDQLLEILETDKDFASFLFDGQTITLEDYLQVKPENYQRLKQLIGDGRIQIGPWYILPDEFAPDGESLVRNLLIGMKISREFGEPMMVGYLPDSFGHSGQMPHILKGFGIDTSVVMRGVDAGKIKQSEFIWRGVNGDEVFTVYLPNGYSNGMFLPKKYREDKFRIRFSARNLKKWASTENILIMNGVDHQFPQKHISDHVKRLNLESGKTKYEISTLEKYIDDVRAADAELPVLEDDLLTPARNRVHSSIASTRIYQKQKNRRMEALLEKYVEPIAAIAWIKKAEYPSGLINQAWKYLIQNQTHDGICGCCLDEVHREMDQRFSDVKNIGETLQNTYARAIARRVSCDRLKLIVFNNAMTQGRQVVRASVFTKKPDFTITDTAKKEIPYQIERKNKVDLSEKSIWTLYLKGNEPAYKTDIVFSTAFNFNAGYKVFSINEGRVKKKTESRLSVDNNVIENEFVKVTINGNGSIDLLDKENENLFRGLHVLEDCGDAGDTYNYSPVKNDTVITSESSAASYEITSTGPLFVEAVISYELSVPIRLDNQDRERSKEKIPLPITTRMRVFANQKRVDFSTEINNTAYDHRLRVLFPVGFKAEYSYAETQFGTIRRDVILDNSNWKKKKWHEKPLPIYSQQKFVDLHNDHIGLAVLNRGLPEYEIYGGETATIAITLLRGVGMMGKSDLIIRPGRPSGIVSPTPDAQCSGMQKLEYSIYTHSGGIGINNVPKQAAMYDAFPLAVQSHLKLKRLLKIYGFLTNFISLETLTGHVYDQLEDIEEADMKVISLSDERLIISALKKAETGNMLIVRFYNSSSSPIRNSTINLGIETKGGYITDFNEEEIAELEKPGSEIYTIPEVGPNSAVTLKFIL